MDKEVGIVRQGALVSAILPCGQLVVNSQHAMSTVRPYDSNQG